VPILLSPFRRKRFCYKKWSHNFRYLFIQTYRQKLCNNNEWTAL
jgi:hypothetical protein